MHRLAQLGNQLSNTKPIKPAEKVTLKGKLIILEPMNAEKHALSLYRNFESTPHLVDLTIEDDLSTLEEFKHRCLQKELDTSNEHWFVASRIDSPGDYISMLCCRNSDLVNRKIEVGGLVLSKKARGTIVPVEMFYLFSSYCIEELNYNRLYGRVHPLNIYSLAAAKKLGCNIEGEELQALVYGERTINVVNISLLAEDWVVHKQILKKWLDRVEFDESGRLKKPDVTSKIRKS